MKKDKEKKESFLSVLFGDDDFKVNDKIFEEDDDTTFNELKDRTEELTNELITEAKEEKKKDEPKKEETTKVEIPEEVVEVKSEEAKKVETAPVVEEQNDSTPVVEEDFDTEIDFSQFGF